jgi:hypothetical protein
MLVEVTPGAVLPAPDELDEPDELAEPEELDELDEPQPASASTIASMAIGGASHLV